eukprot:TRINITY_DN40954_c0_g1_i1.p1 TRINITY_DN40954_c0_g1~~TRINITY_DN40954_c0_g1_i1.p1  ORF type:complete len:233 (+),score=31.08 TRINITY_DN40954_c0_g1_i1:76-699(+)
MARQIAVDERWLGKAAALELQPRVVEFHRQHAPSSGIPDPFHYDLDSLVTLDVMLSEPGTDFHGGQLRTLEPDGRQSEHAFSFGEVLAFQGHKYHCVSPVTSGCRSVLVVEYWRGPARTCPHRCSALGPRCPLEAKLQHRMACPRNSEQTCVADDRSEAPLGAALPFRLGLSSTRIRTTQGGQRQGYLQLFWQRQPSDHEVNGDGGA